MSPSSGIKLNLPWLSMGTGTWRFTRQAVLHTHSQLRMVLHSIRSLLHLYQELQLRHLQLVEQRLQEVFFMEPRQSPHPHSREQRLQVRPFMARVSLHLHSQVGLSKVQQLQPLRDLRELLSLVGPSRDQP